MWEFYELCIWSRRTHMVVDICQMCPPRSSTARTCDLHEATSSLADLDLEGDPFALAAALGATLVLCTRCSCGRCSSSVSFL